MAKASDERTGGPAYPAPRDANYLGMTLRDHFAGIALPVFLAKHPAERFTPEAAAKAAYAVADMMIAESKI